jgi:hypothetical protein
LIEKSFRMSKHDLQARPVYHHLRDSIEAHLTIVFAALAVSRWIEHQTSWSIRKFVKTARRYRTIQIQARQDVITAADPLPGKPPPGPRPNPRPRSSTLNCHKSGQQLGGPVVLVWDGLNTHSCHAMRDLIAARDWLTVFQLPAYAPELNPVEPVWSVLKR